MGDIDTLVVNPDELILKCFKNMFFKKKTV